MDLPDVRQQVAQLPTGASRDGRIEAGPVGRVGQCGPVRAELVDVFGDVHAPTMSRRATDRRHPVQGRDEHEPSDRHRGGEPAHRANVDPATDTSIAQSGLDESPAVDIEDIDHAARDRRRSRDAGDLP
jgi:hypothetical protein